MGEASNCWISAPLSTRRPLRSRWQSLSVCEVRLTFDTDLSHEIQPSLIETSASVRSGACRTNWCAITTSSCCKAAETVARREIRDNGQRLNCLAFEHVDCDTVRVTVRAAHGSPKARIFELRVY